MKTGFKPNTSFLLAALVGGLLFASMLGVSLSDAHALAADVDAIEDDVDKIVTIEAIGSRLEFEQEEIRLETGTTVTIRLDNSQSTMPHNIVLVNGQDDIRPVGIAALRAHQNEYIPENEHDRIIAYSPLAGPGDVMEFTFEVPPPGEYPYVCTYPGHFQTMQGALISVESL